MKVYKVTTRLKELSNSKVETKEDTVVLANDDDLYDFVQMMYGCWFDILDFEYEEGDSVHISKNFIKQEALKIMQIKFE